MGVKSIFDSKLPINWVERCENELNYAVCEAHIDKVIYVMFKAVSGLLSNTKSKTEPTAFIFDNMGSVNAAAIVEFFKDENNQTAEGNWSYIWTFDEDAIPANAKKIYLTDVNTHPYFNGCGTAKFAMSFASDGDLVAIMNVTLEEIKKYLDENAKENEIVGIEVPGIMQARVTVENGVKDFAIEPAGEIKMEIKNDDSIEKK